MIYIYAPDQGRAADRPRFVGCQGVLQEDGFAEYRALAQMGQVLADAIRYALSRWKSPARFFNNSCFEHDFDTVEYATRPKVLNAITVFSLDQTAAANTGRLREDLIAERCRASSLYL